MVGGCPILVTDVQGIAPAMYEELIYDEEGNILNGTLMDYLVPTAVESPKWETGHTVTPSPHHPIGAKGLWELTSPLLEVSRTRP